MATNPKITVVTVSYNAADTIEETMLSVLNQTYQNIEYIIIDGGSTDGTVDIIKRYADRLAHWVSEPDRGIYDAMNKGISVANGDYINFMNAGDKFYSRNVISEISKYMLNFHKVIYGSTFVEYPYGDYIVKPNKLHKIKEQMILCHQSAFVKLESAREHPFKEEYGLVADHGSLLEIYNDSPDSFLEYSGVVSIYDAKNGVSSKNVSETREHEAKLTCKSDSILRKCRFLIRRYGPNIAIYPLIRLYYVFNKRFKQINR